MTGRIAGVILFLTSLALAAQGATYLFDFGAVDSPVADGFTAVTHEAAYTPEKGFGWKVAHRQKLHARCENFSSNRNFLKLDPLHGDHVTGGRKHSYGSQPLVFQLDLPAGDYVGALVMGKLFEQTGVLINRPPFMYRDYAVRVNGREILSVKRDWVEYLKEFQAATEKDFLPGASLFDAYVAPYYRTIRFTFAGPLTLEADSICPLCALLVYPKEEGKLLDAKLAELHQGGRDFLDRQYEERIPEQEDVLSADALDRRAQRGCVFFTRPHDEPTPYDRPSEREIGKAAAEFLSPGETATLRFSVYPTRVLEDVRLDAGALTSESGATIGREHLSLWIAKYSSSPATLTGEKYSVRGWHALPYAPMDFAARVARTLYLYAKAPPDCAPGVYRGSVRMSVAGAASGEVAIMLKVLPVALRSPDMLFGMYAGNPPSGVFRFARWDKTWAPGCRAISADVVRKMFLDMREAGFNTVSYSLPWTPFKMDAQGSIQTQEDIWSEWEDTFEAYKEVFGNTPAPFYQLGYAGLVSPGSVPGLCSRPTDEGADKETPPEVLVNVEKLLRHFYARVKENEWPEVMLYMSDELSNYGMRGGRFGAMRARQYRAIADRLGFRVCASLNGPAEHDMLPYLDVAIPNGGFPINDETIAKIRKAGCELWFYNIGATRFTYGYYLAKTRPKGRLQWNFGSSSRFFENVPALPSIGAMSYGLILDSSLDVGRRYDVEQMRQGILDYRYFITLEELVRKHASAKNPPLAEAARKGRELLDYITDGIHTDVKHYARVGMWESETCHRLRWMLAQAIEEIDHAER